MQQSTSTSCLRRKDVATSPLSVTIVSRETLPSFSSERFFLLSEIEEHSARPVFYLDTNTNNNEADTVETAAEEDPFSNYLILYLLKTPEDPQDPDQFVEKVIVSQIQRLQTHVNIGTAEELNTTPDDDELPSAQVYIVIERIHSCVDDNDEHLAKTVASHSLLRPLVAGVTVASSNHTRAAPGLDAMYRAIAVTGARDRRRRHASSSSKSLLHVVTPCLEHLVPSSADEPEAADAVTQSRVAAEWNGQGTLETFAAKAHGAWRRRNGMAAVESSHRKVPRRITKQHQQQQAVLAVEMVYDCMAVLLFLVYVAYHFL